MRVLNLYHLFYRYLLIAIFIFLHGCATINSDIHPAPPNAPATPPTAPPPAIASPQTIPQAAPPAAPSLPLPAAAYKLISLATAAENNGDLEQAERLLDRAQRIAPRHAQVYIAMAELRMKKGEYAQAEELAKRALSFQNFAAPEFDQLNAIIAQSQQHGAAIKNPQ